ncbi:DUF6701 domain-containing protein [Vibrio fluminensis]|uniref:DUF6701 domain-containing protein n=1 Tax=Vibrio fluminensis TaxID=2783614 RepID=UPI0018873870|nr:DUF6701 domain-containing protein [Vibrio fluminensis]
MKKINTTVTLFLASLSLAMAGSAQAKLEKLDPCLLVPGVAQTNSYSNLKPYGSLHGIQGNQIILNRSDILSFGFDVHGKYCFYDGDTSASKCVISNDVAYEGFPLDLGEFPRSSRNFTCDADSHCKLSPGSYKKVVVEDSATIEMSGGYSISQFDFNPHSNLVLNNDTQVHYQYINLKGNDIKVNQVDEHSLLFVGHGSEAFFIIGSDRDSNANSYSGIRINAHVYVHESATSRMGFDMQARDNTFSGGVTANAVNITGIDNILNGKPAKCLIPTPDVARIVIEPTNMYLQCADSNQVYVYVYDEDNQLITEIGDNQVELYTTTKDLLTFSSPIFDANLGRFVFDIVDKKNNDYGPIAVKAHLVGAEKSVFDTSDVVFAPVVFAINNGSIKELIAGKPDSLNIQALACDTSDKPVVGNYQQILDKSHLINEQFSPGEWGNNVDELEFSADFKNGQANASIQFDEAGEFVATLKDTVKCSDFGADVQDCPADREQAVIGELKFKARPWTFALCRSDLSSLPSGNITASTSAQFVAAGQEFALTALPIRWQSGGKISGDVTTLNRYCNASLITENFAKGGAGSIDVTITHELSQPSIASGGHAGSLSGVKSKPYTSSATSGHYLFDQLSWNEVGQLKLKVDSDNYLAMDIQAGTKKVGRFYPHYFAINKTEWVAPDHQGGVTYLSQPFKHAEVKVAALAVDGTSVKNYHYFDESLQANLTLWSESSASKSNELILDVSSGAWRADSDSTSGYSYWELESSDAKVLRREISSTGIRITTKENGPFNLGSGFATTDYGLQLSGIDPVFFDVANTEDLQLFIHQPKLRYGRMVLSSLGGVSGAEMKVPLKVEYWDGSSFITSFDDDASKFVAEDGYQCKRTVWPTPVVTSDSKLSGPVGETAISAGISELLTATADSSDSSLREQVQFWLRLDDTSTTTHTSPQVGDPEVSCGTSGVAQPWLQYNWHGQGDEDPSAVVTFGIYRGNDKIIFRSESGLTSQ